MADKPAPIRGAIAFFLVTFSTAFLMTVGARLTNWFTDAPKTANNETTGVAIMVAVVTLALGFSLRRMTLMEFRSALLGGAAVLLAISLSGAVSTDSLTGVFTFIFLLGVLLLLAGLFVSWRIGVREIGDKDD
jgi:hypothetical protein